MPTTWFGKKCTVFWIDADTSKGSDISPTCEYRKAWRLRLGSRDVVRKNNIKSVSKECVSPTGMSNQCKPTCHQSFRKSVKFYDCISSANPFRILFIEYFIKTLKKATSRSAWLGHCLLSGMKYKIRNSDTGIQQQQYNLGMDWVEVQVSIWCVSSY